MSYAPANHEGHIAIESTDEPPRTSEASLLSVLGVAGRLRRRIAEVLESVELSHPGYEVLAHLRGSEGRVALEALAEALRRPAVETAALLDQLAGRGLVRVIEEGTPGAPAQVTLTPFGSARALEGRRLLDIVLLEFAARFGATERVELRRLLDKVAR